MHVLGPLLGGGLAGLFQISYHKTKKSVKKEALKANVQFQSEVELPNTGDNGHAPTDTLNAIHVQSLS